MKQSIIFLLMFLASACSSEESYTISSWHRYQGEIIGYDDINYFLFTISLDNKTSSKAKVVLPKPSEVKLVIQGNVYKMKMMKNSDYDSKNSNIYNYRAEITPQCKYKEGSKYYFTYKVNGKKFKSDVYNLKYARKKIALFNT